MTPPARRSLRTAIAAVLAALAVGVTAAAAGASPQVLLADDFGGPDGLVTNAYATWNEGEPDAVRSPTWRVTSGSLFRRDGTLWTGVPDGRRTDARSERGTESAVLRAMTERDDFGDVTVEARLRVNELVETDRTPAVAWDGVHVFLRRQSEYHLYYASVSRRDGSVVIKKKVPGGPSNGGTYHTLGSAVAPMLEDQWAHLQVSVDTRGDGTVALSLRRDGVTLLEVVDAGVGGAPITAPGRVGIRGDNADFQLDDLRVRS